MLPGVAAFESCSGRPCQCLDSDPLVFRAPLVEVYTYVDGGPGSTQAKRMLQLVVGIPSQFPFACWSAHVAVVQSPGDSGARRELSSFVRKPSRDCGAAVAGSMEPCTVVQGSKYWI